MRRIGFWLAVIVLGLQAPPVRADDESKRIFGGVVSGLLGDSEQAPDAVYVARERNRLATYLQSGEYATSRQGEIIDMVVFGVPLTHRDHIYVARPIAPSPFTDLQNR